MELTATRFDIDERVATVYLHRPHRHNAWTGQMHREVRAIFAELERGDVRVVVLTGTPPAFCVGGDRHALEQHAERGEYDTGVDDTVAKPGGSASVSTFDADMAWMFSYPLPIIAAVNGACAGIGLALAMFTDLRFGAADAKLTTAAPKLGLPAEYGLSWVLPRLVGISRAADLLFSGRVVTVGETADWGCWNGVEADGESALRSATSYARELVAATGPQAVRTTKSQLYADITRHDVAASVRDSKRLLGDAMATAEYREGIRAFTERRPPQF